MAKPIESLGELQAAVMEAVWELKEATVHQVRDRLAPRKKLAYTTVLSAMQKLEKAGLLSHRAVGRVYVYFPTTSREDQGKSTLKRLMKKVFAGNPLLLFEHLLDDKRIGAEELDELKKMIDRKRKERRDE